MLVFISGIRTPENASWGVIAVHNGGHLNNASVLNNTLNRAQHQRKLFKNMGYGSAGS